MHSGGLTSKTAFIILTCVQPEECLHEVFFTCQLSVQRTQATFKRYQSEHKLKQDSLDRSKTDLKKLRRKSQGKSSSKYELKENEVSAQSPSISVQMHRATLRAMLVFLCP